MKRMSIFRILAVLVIATIFFGACTKEKSDVRLAPTLATTQVLSIKSDSATVVGFVVAEGDGFTEKGVCFNTTAGPTIANNKVAYSGPTTMAAYKVKIGGLKYATKYYTRAYATNVAGTIYGEEYSFTTLSVVPFLTTTVISAITGTTATSGGNITDNGGEAVTARGVCWSIVHNPTITDSKTSDDKGNGLFTSSLTNLLGKTTYFVRAYATNTIGTSYGPEVSFITLVAVPTLTTTAVANVTASGASSGGNITLDGGGAILSRGICWSTTLNPTITDTKTSNGTGIGTFTSTLANLSVATLYHVRAYATNSAGISYGPDVQFMTFPPAIYALGDGTTAVWDNNAAVKVDQSSTPGVYVGMLDLSAAKSLKFILGLGSWQPQWGQASGQPAGTLGVNLGNGTDPDAIVTPVAAGKFKVTVDLSTMTYKIESAFPDNMFVVGAATAVGWPVSGPGENAGTGMHKLAGGGNNVGVYWKVLHLAGGQGFKISNTNWASPNIGFSEVTSFDANGVSVTSDGGNLSVASSGIYTVVLDLRNNAIKVSIVAAKVYGMGDCFGGWTSNVTANLFTTNLTAKTLISPALSVAGNIRMYVSHPWITDWWNAEFNVYGTEIQYRNDGGDQAAVPGTVGKVITLHFDNNTGSIN